MLKNGMKSPALSCVQFPFDCAHQCWLCAGLNCASLGLARIQYGCAHKMCNFLFDCAYHCWLRAGLKCASLGIARISVRVRAYFLRPARILVSRRAFSPCDARILVRFRAKIPEFETRILVFCAQDKFRAF